ncbi:TetR/AcrR family transcriptional regulator [Pseudonocardia oroxyli]|uniref:Transcriptional regulator, TetR family n=1 Tax=Pseudonocardia oroxyli TaxID=366584 RepID=A0A1G8EKW8_PSEOR|nr:TetR/AcrR family transcriptional regulator [Pseudonocardia oroxyli]SDH70491.1 transcriptional regulator, TetR family [Pseudonocardia oroxyli]
MEASEALGAVGAAVERALERQRTEATKEVEAILEAALRVAERADPDPPRVADIVAEAGTSNQAFYRYFRGKDDLMDALLQRGLARLRTYLAHQVDKEVEPRAQVTAWIRGVFTQVTDEQAARQSVAVMRQLRQVSARPHPETADTIDRMAGILVEPIRRLGSSHPENDARLVQEVAFGAMNVHARHGTSPDESEIEHAIGFCLRGLTVPIVEPKPTS